MKAVYQWILRDNQEMSFPRFVLTQEYFSTKDEINLYAPALGECFTIVGRYLPSRVDDAYLVGVIKGIQNERKSGGSKDK